MGSGFHILYVNIENSDSVLTLLVSLILNFYLSFTVQAVFSLLSLHLNNVTLLFR